MTTLQWASQPPPATDPVNQYLQQDVYGPNSPTSQLEHQNPSPLTSNYGIHSSAPAQHISFFHHYFGTTPLEVAVNIALLFVVIYGLYIAYTNLLEPLLDTLKSPLKFRRLIGEDAVFLEITPPTHVEKSPLATRQLFSTIRQVMSRDDVLSLEIVASGSTGTRFLLRTRASNVDVLQRHIASHVHEARFRILDHSDRPEEAGTTRYSQLFELGQFRHYAYPLQPQENYADYDLITTIAGAMTKLEAGEAIVLQMVVRRHYSLWTNRLRNKLLHNGYAVLDNPVRSYLIARWWVWTLAVIFGSLTHSLKTGLSWVVFGLFVNLFIRKKDVKLQPAEQEIYKQALEKLSQPLFKADIRVFVAAKDRSRETSLSTNVHSALAPLNVPGFQSLVIKHSAPVSFIQKFDRFKFANRLPSLLPFNSSVLAASELADIYHFPYSDTDTEDLVKSRSRTLSAPLSIKTGSFDVLFGRNHHHGTTTNIGLTAKQREQHMYVIGATGTGKSTMLQYAIMQDIMAGKGVAVLDPHGDLAEKVLRYIPEERLNDVIYFEPSDVSYPIGLNMLELPEGIYGDQLLLAQDFVTDAVISVFRKIFSEDDSGGHRIENVLRHATHTAFTVEGANLFTIRKLLNNPDFRKGVVAKLEDEDLKDFWIHEFGIAGNFQKYKAMDGVISKIGRFQRSVVTRRILEQAKSTIDFDEVLNGKILICNLAKGKIGEDTSAVLGTAILTRLQLAAFRRISIPEDQRKPFHAYVDEFQNFVSPLFIQMLSESRKYKLFLVMAEQSTSQQDRQLTENILGNAGTVVCFRTGNPADEELMLHQFKGRVKEGEIIQLPIYNFYMRTSSENAQEILSGKTVELEEPGSESIAKKIKVLSRKNYTKKYKPPKPTAESKQEPPKPQTDIPETDTSEDFPEDH